MRNQDKIKALKLQLADLDKEYDEYMDYLKGKEYDDEAHAKNIKLVNARADLRDEIRELNKIPEVGMCANQHLWSDVHPYEIVRVVSDKTLEIRPMKAELDPNWKPEIIVGGFAGHCVNNNEQKWIYEQNLEAPVIRIRKKKDRDEWVHKGLNYRINIDPIRFYDYNY